MKTLTTYQVSRNLAWSFILIFIWTIWTFAPLAARSDNFSSLAYEGVLTDASGNYVNLNGVDVTFSIVNGTSCVIFQEKHPAGDASGNVFHRIGTGTNVYGAQGMPGDPPLSSNHFTSSVSCMGGGSSNTSNGYSLKIEVSSPSFSATMPISAVPFAMAASDSAKLNGKSDSDFVNINSGSGVTQSNVENIFSSYTKLNALLSAKLDVSGNYTGNISGNAATATLAGNVSGTVSVANGGTGTTTLSANSVLVGNGTSPVQTVAPGTSGNVLTSNGTTWVSSPASGSVTSVASKTGAVTLVAADITDFATATDTQANARIAAAKGANNGVASLDGSGKVPSNQLALSPSDIPYLGAEKITSGTFGNAMISGLGIEKLINQTTKYFNYKPDNTACDNNDVLKYDSTLDSGNGGWKCATDDYGTGTGTVNSSTANKLAYYDANGTTVSGLSVGSGNQILGMDATGTGHEYKTITAGTGVSVSHTANIITISATGAPPTGAAGGDLSGTYPNPEVSKIKNQTITAAGSAAGQVLRYAGSNNWTPAYVGMQDLRSNVTGSPQLGTACGANKTITYDSVSDALACTSIAITSAQVSGLATVATSGDYNNLANKPSLGSLATKSSVDLGTSDTSGTLPIGKGGTNNGSLPVTPGGVIYTDGSKLLNSGAGTLGQVLKSMGTGAPTWSNMPIGLPASTGSASNPGYTFTGDLDTGMFGDGDQIGFSTAGSEKVRINAAGNVGIGTTSPQQQLHVNGAAYITGSLLLATGSISSNEAVVINAGGTDKDINLIPSGSGKVRTMGASLHVDGAITSKTTSATGSTVDFLSTNIAYTSSSCGTFNLHNLADGGTYQLIIQGTGSATCQFNAYSDGGSTQFNNSTNVHMPPGHGPTIASKHTLYSFLVAGGHVYVSWVPGY